jgi:LysR family hydrogen peroxide-inducible transcriptional activator
MTLVELKYLVALAVERHFGRAARASHISQPTLSAAIKNLEAELGVTLVERGTGHVRVTPVGEEVVAQARRVLDEAARVTLIAQQAPTPLRGTLRIGVISTLAPFALIPLVVPMLRAHPKLNLVLREGLTHELLALLRLGELDGVLLALPAGGSDLENEALFDEPFIALLPASSPLAEQQSVSAADLIGARLILLTEGHCFRDQALDVCRGHIAFEEPSRDQLAATSLHTIWRMVEAGLGCTLMPQLAADDMAAAAKHVTLLPVSPTVPSRRIGVAWRRGSAATDDVRALGAFIRGHLPKQVVPVPA